MEGLLNGRLYFGDMEAMPVNNEKDRQTAKAALAKILSMEKRLPEDFDPKKELQEAREEIISQNEVRNYKESM